LISHIVQTSVVSVNNMLNPPAMQGASTHSLVFRYSVLYGGFFSIFMSGLQLCSPYGNLSRCAQVLVEIHAACQAVSSAACFQFIAP